MKRAFACWLAVGAVALSSALSSTASAEDKKPAGGAGVLQLGEITIVGRVQKPIASVDVSKIQPKLTLAELKQAFLDRIEEVVSSDPF